MSIAPVATPVFSANRPRGQVSGKLVTAVQLIALGVTIATWTLSASADRTAVSSAVLRRPWPLESLPEIPPPKPVPSLYDDPAMVSDEQLAAVLKKLIPRFSQSQLRPNLIEHALRTWGSEIRFGADDTISGPELATFLTDSAKHLQSWNHRVTPLLVDTGLGVHVRFSEDAAGSVHHDHALAALTESGLPLEAPVFTTSLRCSSATCSRKHSGIFVRMNVKPSGLRWPSHFGWRVRKSPAGTRLRGVLSHLTCLHDDSFAATSAGVSASARIASTL